MYASGRHHEFFDNPEEFKPERFIMTDSEAETLY
jgi:cytochrome P450